VAVTLLDTPSVNDDVDVNVIGGVTVADTVLDCVPEFVAPVLNVDDGLGVVDSVNGSHG